MKKLITLILAGLLTASCVLVSCTPKTAVEKDGKDSKADNAVEEGGFSIGTPEQLLNNVKFNADFEKKLAEVVEMKDLDKEILLNISGVPVSASLVRYAVIACNSSSMGTEEEKQAEIDRYFRVNAYVVNKAIEMGIEITEEDFTTNFTDVYAQLQEQFGDDLETVIDQYTLQTPYAYFQSMYYNLLYSKIFDIYSADEEFTSKVRSATLDDMLSSETPYVRAKHILISFPEEGEGEDGAVTDAQKKATLDKANEVLALVESGEDFDALIKEYGEDPGMNTYTGGYYFTTGMMVPEFEETSFALEEGAVSGLVETTYGYHIIQRLPLDDDAILATDEYMNKGYELFADELDVLSAEYDIIASENYEARCADFYAEYEEMMQPAEEPAEEHDHEAEAEVEAETEVAADEVTAE